MDSRKRRGEPKRKKSYCGRTHLGPSGASTRTRCHEWPGNPRLPLDYASPAARAPPLAFGLAGAGSLDLSSVGRAVIGTALFVLASFTLGRRLVFRLIRWSNDNFKSDFPVITTILVIMAVMALITQLIGVSTVLGA